MEIKTQLQIHWDVDPKSMTLNTPDKKWVAVDDEIKWLKKYLLDLKEQTETDGEDLPNWCIYKDIEKRIKQLNGDINK